MSELSMRERATAQRPHHPGMTRSWFLSAVNRALAADLKVYEGPRRNIVIVPSESEPGLLYTTSRQWCTCPGHMFTGRCLHRALAIAWIDVLHMEPLARERGRVETPDFTDDRPLKRAS
jgi:hypothetical protein